MDNELKKSINLFFEELGFAIEQVINFGELYIVRVDTEGSIKYGDTKLDRNVYAYNERAEQVWQIEAAPIERSPKPYMHLEIRNGELIAGNWIGVDLVVDTGSGQVKPDPERMGRPW